ncbi:RNI-like protein [Rozella allomycis CSF55]|uniref:RNI-like protein n=1 Tax=Rozella allomycis (strain CSF55) TaxID=988480 RepID=A0A4V1IZR1_ROZAC|nr:RNI-like protein [Rozella allomycis CSF55]
MTFSLVGKRFCIENRYKGTILFQGNLENVEGTWLGIEWDDLERGKHNGEHKGVKYFNPKVANCGSFVKMNDKFINNANFGTSFLAALSEKYSASDEIYDQGLIAFGGSNIMVETVGFKKIENKITRLESLEEIGISDYSISEIDNPEEIQEKLQSVREIDLSKNLIASWNEVLNLHCLSKLDTLRLKFYIDECIKNVKFENLKVVSLNHTFLTWPEFLLIEESMPCLEELSLAFNELKDLNEDLTNKLRHLKVLNLEHNSFTDWKNISQLAKLPSLKCLKLNNNQFCDVVEEGVEFLNLETLNLNANKFDKIGILNELSIMKKLKELRIGGNPFCVEFKSNLLIEAVGRIAGLEKFNGSSITKDNRLNFERYYVNKQLQRSESLEEIIKENPRLKELCSKHEIELQKIQSESSKSNLASNFIEFEIRGNKISLKKKFPKNLTISKLKLLLQKLLKIEIKNISINSVEANELVELDCDHFQISSYGNFKHNDILIINK